MDRGTIAPTSYMYIYMRAHAHAAGALILMNFIFRALWSWCNAVVDG